MKAIAAPEALEALREAMVAPVVLVEVTVAPEGLVEGVVAVVAVVEEELRELVRN